MELETSDHDRFVSLERKEERKERPQSPRTSRRDDNNLEKVSVEMNSVEQDVYALMGVSPLIRLNRDFKDTRSVIVNVKKPGELDDVTNTTQVLLATENQLDLEIDVVEAVNNLDLEPEIDDDNDESDYENRPLIRRRRRRSSAREIEV